MGNEPNLALFLLGLKPVIDTPPLAVAAGEILQTEVTVPWAGTWINQQQLIGAQQPRNTIPLILAKDSPCFAKWSTEPGGNQACW